MPEEEGADLGIKPWGLLSHFFCRKASEKSVRNGCLQVLGWTSSAVFSTLARLLQVTNLAEVWPLASLVWFTTQPHQLLHFFFLVFLTETEYISAFYPQLFLRIKCCWGLNLIQFAMMLTLLPCYPLLGLLFILLLGSFSFAFGVFLSALNSYFQDLLCTFDRKILL